VYLECSSSDSKDNYGSGFYVLEEGRWVTSPVQRHKVAVQVVDAEGAMWHVVGGMPGPTWLERKSRDGKVERLDPPSAPSELFAPFYRTSTVELAAESDGKIKEWLSASIIAEKEAAKTGWIHTMIPLRSGDVWVIGRDSGDVRRGATLVRYTRRGVPSTPPVLLRSAADERNEVHNARGVRRWAGHCVSVFVPFPRPPRGPDGAVLAPSTEYYHQHQKEFDEAVARLDKKKHSPVEVSLVEGLLGGERVAGIVFLRSDPEADEATMEAVATRVAEIATPNPASPPATTCSLPALHKLVTKLHSAAE
jgi:hypothetical protein